MRYKGTIIALWLLWAGCQEIGSEIKPIETAGHLDTGAVFCPRCGWDSTIIFRSQAIKKQKKR
jgi:hypothetical protein